jgi:hypothetical protein
MIVTLQNRRLSAVVFVVLCGAPLCAEAQQFACWPIVRGDTAYSLARRLTGAAATAYSDAFQIKDPARRMFVPKSRYSQLSTDWQACVARDRVAGNLLAPARAPAPAVAPPAPPLRYASPRYDVGFALRFGAAVSLMLLMISAAASYAAPRPIPPAMQRAGADFVTAFATPLVDPTSAVPPIAARLRFRPRAERLEIGLAPHGGRRYPNLSDHKKNVEYDVNRVIRILGAHRIVCDRLHAEGPWVIVSIRLTEPKQAGAT